MYPKIKSQFIVATLSTTHLQGLFNWESVEQDNSPNTDDIERALTHVLYTYTS